MSKLLPAAALALTLAAAPAVAAPILSEPGVSEFRPSPGSYTFLFDAVEEGVAILKFNIVGRGSLDGQGAACDLGDCSDVFNLIYNGSDLLQMSMRLGGLGTDTVLSSSTPFTFSITSGDLGQGGVAEFAVPILLRAGMNSLTFAYTGIDQGMDDEAWAIGDVLIDDGRATTVPEPATWALMIGGFGLTGAALRRRRGVLAA